MDVRESSNLPAEEVKVEKIKDGEKIETNKKASLNEDTKIECAVCFLPYTENIRCPISLTCGHTFCRLCVDQLTSNNYQQQRVKCPTCRANSPKAEKNLDLTELLKQTGNLDDEKDLSLPQPQPKVTNLNQNHTVFPGSIRIMVSGSEFGVFNAHQLHNSLFPMSPIDENEQEEFMSIINNIDRIFGRN